MALPGNTAYGRLNSGTTIPGQTKTVLPPRDPSGAGGANPPAADDSDPYKSTPYNSPIPNIYDYGGAEARANQAYADALAGINSQRQQLLSANGYQGDVDAKTGQINNLRVDPYNPYGQFQQMLNSQAYQDMAADDDAAGRGLHGGLAHQASSQLGYQHGVDRNNFGNTMFSNIQQLIGAQGNAAQTRDSSIFDAQNQSAMAALIQGLFNPANYGGKNDTPPVSTDPAAATAGVFDPLNNLTAADWAKYGQSPSKAPSTATSRAASTAAKILKNKKGGKAQ